MMWLTMISKSTHQNRPLPSFMFLSLVLWSGNHLDGRKIGHCKLKLDKLLFCFGQTDDDAFPVNE